MKFEDWALRYPRADLAQRAIVQEYWERLDESERTLLQALSPLALPGHLRGTEGPLGEAFRELLQGPRAEPLGAVLRRAERGEYPLLALRSLLLQYCGKRIEARSLRARVRAGLGVWPRAEIVSLPPWMYRPVAAEIGFPLAFYRPDTIYVEAGVSDEILFHELVHSAHWRVAGSVPPAQNENERVALVLLEALTEEWASRNGGGNLYRAERDALGAEAIEEAELQRLVLMPPGQILDDFSAGDRSGFLENWKESLSKTATAAPALVI